MTNIQTSTVGVYTIFRFMYFMCIYITYLGPPLGQPFRQPSCSLSAVQQPTIGTTSASIASRPMDGSSTLRVASVVSRSNRSSHRTTASPYCIRSDCFLAEPPIDGASALRIASVVLRSNRRSSQRATASPYCVRSDCFVAEPPIDGSGRLPCELRALCRGAGG